MDGLHSPCPISVSQMKLEAQWGQGTGAVWDTFFWGQMKLLDSLSLFPSLTHSSLLRGWARGTESGHRAPDWEG
jgi:hypothetical protein